MTLAQPLAPHAETPVCIRAGFGRVLAAVAAVPGVVFATFLLGSIPLALLVASGIAACVVLVDLMI